MTDSASTDPYDVLQVRRNALPEVVRAAYRALAWKYHPDTGAQPDRMVAINEAWHVLGHPARRADYDRLSSAPTQAAAPRSTNVDAVPVREHGLAQRPLTPAPVRAENAIDFGRYEGWTIDQLVNHDPDYLRWLARTPVGRRLAPQIDAALSGRDRQPQRLAPRSAAPRRSFFSGLAARVR